MIPSQSATVVNQLSVYIDPLYCTVWEIFFFFFFKALTLGGLPWDWARVTPLLFTQQLPEARDFNQILKLSRHTEWTAVLECWRRNPPGRVGVEASSLGNGSPIQSNRHCHVKLVFGVHTQTERQMDMGVAVHRQQEMRGYHDRPRRLR